MIYSTNRTASLGELSVDVNESYFGIGAMSFMEESARDELAIFESAIKSDIDEVLIGESSYELAALNENFVDTAMNKIKEMMEKFIAWVESVIRSAWAKLNQLLNRDNAKFAAAARKQIIGMKNKDKFKYSGPTLKAVTFGGDFEDIDINKIKAGLTKENPSLSDMESLKAEAESMKEKADKLSVSDAMKEVTVDVTDAGLDVVNFHLTALEDLGRKRMKDLKKQLDKAKKDAKDILKKAKDSASKVNSDEKSTEDQKKIADAKVEAASAYRTIVQKSTTFMLGMIKAQAKIARKVVAKAMGATPKNEGVEYDEILTNAMIEAAEYEYDSAMEEMSEGSKCEECDDSDDDDFDDDDMD